MQHFKDDSDQVFAFEDDLTAERIEAIRPGLTSITEAQASDLLLPSATALQHAKDARKEHMREQAKSEINSSFTSSALGTAHTYDSREEDQNNLSMASDEAAATSASVEVYANNGVEYTYVDHTLAQVQQVRADCSDHVRVIRKKLITKKSAIDAAADIAAVNAINW